MFSSVLLYKHFFFTSSGSKIVPCSFRCSLPPPMFINRLCSFVKNDGQDVTAFFDEQI